METFDVIQLVLDLFLIISILILFYRDYQVTRLLDDHLSEQLDELEKRADAYMGMTHETPNINPMPFKEFKPVGFTDEMEKEFMEKWNEELAGLPYHPMITALKLDVAGHIANMTLRSTMMDMIHPAAKDMIEKEAAKYVKDDKPEETP